MASSRLTWVIEPDLTKEVRVGGKKVRREERRETKNRKQKGEARREGEGGWKEERDRGREEGKERRRERVEREGGTNEAMNVKPQSCCVKMES